jgi:hypothetical protein
MYCRQRAEVRTTTVRRRTRRRAHKAKAGSVIDQQRWKLSLLRSFVARHGWAKLKPDTVVPPGVNLHRWVTHRRGDYRADRIPDWLVPECESIPGWSWNVFHDAYVRNLDNLRAFAKKHGWDVVATTKPIVDGVRLDKWVAHRRDDYRKGELDAWLIRGLEAIPGWTWDPLRAGYERKLRELRAYVARHGWSSIQTHTSSKSGFHVGHWAGAMRAMRRRGEIPEWVAAELEKIPGWTWEPLVARQLANVARLATFVSKEGWEAVSNSLVVDGNQLGAWVNNCRMRYRRGSLSKETALGLEAIPGWSWSGADTRALIHRQRVADIATRIAELEELRRLNEHAPRKPSREAKVSATKQRPPKISRASRKPKRSRSKARGVVLTTPIPSKRTAVAALVKVTRAAGRPLPSNELPFALYDALLHYFGGIHRARRAANLPDPPQVREWTKADAIAEVRRLHDDGLTIRYRDLELAGREDLVGAIRTYVGSIVRARVLASVPHPPRAAWVQEFWDEDRVVEDIVDLHDAGQPLAYSRAPSKLSNAGIRYFGSWDNALFAAGLDPDDIRLRRRPYDHEQMIERIRELAREQPAMNFGDLHKHPDGQALSRRFGSLETGLRAAELTEWPVRVVHDSYTKEEVIAALEARHRAGKSLRKTAIEEDSRLLLGIRRRFKTLGAALSAAGLEREMVARQPRRAVRPRTRARDRMSPRARRDSPRP